MMKKVTLIFAFVAFLSYVGISQSLTWQFANFEVVNAGTQLQFDVQVKASTAGTFVRDLQIYFDYNTAGFGSGIASSITVTPLTLMDNFYDFVNIADNTTSKIAIITDADNEMTQPGTSTHFNEMPTSFEGLFTVTMPVISNTELAGISFDETLMNGGQYYQDAPAAPHKYVAPATYANNLLTEKLSTLYGVVKYSVPTGLPIHDCTVTLKQGATVIGTATTDINGNYYFSGIDDGSYTIETTCSLTPGNAKSTDLTLLNDYLLLVGPLTSLQLLAGDLNWDGQTKSTDLGILNDYLLLVIPRWSWNAPDWVFEVQNATVSSGQGNNNYEGLCSGDINGDYTGF
jgi:hypothetical protein